jgi:hypothetical protein
VEKETLQKKKRFFFVVVIVKKMQIGQNKSRFFLNYENVSQIKRELDFFFISSKYLLIICLSLADSGEGRMNFASTAH